MIKIVPDANVIVAGMISPIGAAREIINLSYAKKVILFGSQETYNEFNEIIRRKNLQKYIKKQYFTTDKILSDYRLFINIINPYDILKNLKVVTRDHDDDIYISVALASNSNILLSRDRHLLDLKKYKSIRMVDPDDFLKSWRRLNNGNLF